MIKLIYESIHHIMKTILFIINILFMALATVLGFFLVIFYSIILAIMWLFGQTIVINKQKYRYFWKI